MASILLGMQNIIFERSLITGRSKVISIGILIFHVSIVLPKLLKPILLRPLSSIVIIRTVLVLNLIEPVSSITCISSVAECFRPHHILFDSGNLLVWHGLILTSSKVIISTDLELRSLMFSLVEGKHGIRLGGVLESVLLWLLLLELCRLVKVTFIVRVIDFITFIYHNFCLFGHWLGSVSVTEVSLHHHSLSFCFMSASEAWQFAENVLCILILIGFDITIIDSPFVLGHESSVPFLIGCFIHLGSKSTNILLSSSLLFLLLLQICCFTQ